MAFAVKCIVIFILALILLFTIFVVAVCINEECEKKRNREKGNLHITVDRDWEKRFKNNK